MIRIKDYLFIARIDHWFKNVFIFPGVAVAMVLCAIPFSAGLLENVAIAFISCCFIASANYVINEWLDAESDKFHPVKKLRPGATGHLQAKYVYTEYALFVIIGLTLGSMISFSYVVTSLVLLMMGYLYNTPPFRTKDIVYLDVASESINNPLRFILGWFAVANTYLPPSSILISYWAGGAFLMAVKRYAEYCYIDDPERAKLYRKSFGRYSKKSLLLYSVFCALVSCFFLAIFLIKYRAEFILSFPFFALLFVWYLAIGMQPLSPTQSPEKFYKEKKFSAYLVLLILIVTTLLFVDIPLLHTLQTPIQFKY